MPSTLGAPGSSSRVRNLRFIVGEVGHAKVTFTRDGEPVDPETVILLVEPPTSDVETYDVDSGVTNPDIGVYEFEIEFTEEGLWKWRWEASGGLKSAAQGEQRVDPANIEV